MLRRPPLHYPDIPLHGLLDRAADRDPEAAALFFGDETFTYRELDGLTNALANGLLEQGIGPGDRVAVAVTNRPEWIIAAYGISRTGASVVMPNPLWKELEFRHALELTRPRAVIADAEMAPTLAAAGAPPFRICVDPDGPAGWSSFWDLVYGSSGQRPPPLSSRLAETEAALPFSSGTTGLPKAVRHSHRSIIAAIIKTKAALNIGSADRLQVFLPLFHIYGILIVGMALDAGAPMRLFRRFDLDTMLRNIEDERVTIGFGAAPIAVAMANHPALEKYDLSSIRYFSWGATPISPSVAENVTQRSGVRWVPAYGTTEVPGMHCNPVDRPDRCRLDTPGLPDSDTEIDVVSLDDGRPVPPGEQGEIVVRGPDTMLGYLPEEANADAFLPGGWFRTGDVGWVEPDGWIHLTDRAKEMLKVSAFQVAPVELENVLRSHPGVADCAVYGIPDERAGEVPKAAVVVRPEVAVTADELIGWVAERLATYKHLRYVEFVSEIPRTPSGKVLRRILKEREG
jgi:acyl-CoA synthetase (AMP-forming)/AMP-acid ligase II